MSRSIFVSSNCLYYLFCYCCYKLTVMYENNFNTITLGNCGNAWSVKMNLNTHTSAQLNIFEFQNGILM